MQNHNYSNQCWQLSTFIMQISATDSSSSPY